MRLTLEIGKKWRQGEISDIGDVTPPDQPSRDDKLNVVAPGKEKRRGKGGSQVIFYISDETSVIYLCLSKCYRQNRTSINTNIKQKIIKKTYTQTHKKLSNITLNVTRQYC